MLHPMKTRDLALPAVALGLVLTLAGCGNDDPTSSDEPTKSASTTASPTPSATETTPTPTPAPTSPPTTPPTTKKTPKPAGKYAALAGDWQHKDPEFWTLHFKADGTFVEDFDGVKEIRTGTFTVNGSSFLLKGGDGDNSKGTLKGNTLTFGEEVLTKQ